MLWTLISFVGFTILVAVISYFKTKGDNQSTSEGYFLAGRGLPGFVIAGSLLLTNLSAEQLVGSNGQTWLVGMSPMAFEVLAAPCCIALALFAAPRYLKSGITTIPQLIGLRFDRSTKLWFSILYIVLALVVQIPVVLYSGSLVFENIFGLSGILGVTKFQAIVILCIAISVIGSIYAIFGGLKAVAVSDTVNGIGLLIGVPRAARAGQHRKRRWYHRGYALPDREPFGYAQLYRSGGIFCTGCSVADRIYGHGHSRPAVVVHQSGVCTARTRRKESEGSTEGCSAVCNAQDHRLYVSGSAGRYRLRTVPAERYGDHHDGRCVPDHDHADRSCSADGLFRGCHVRRDPVLVQLVPQLHQYHVHP